MPSDKPRLSKEKQICLNIELVYAAEKGDNAKIELLLEQGADIAAKSISGGTALHNAAFEGHTQTCALIIQRYAESGGNVKEFIAAEDSYLATAVQRAAAHRHPYTARFIYSMLLLQDLAGEETLRFMESFRECVSS